MTYTARLIEDCKNLIVVPKTIIYFILPLKVVRNCQVLIQIYGVQTSYDGKLLVMDILEKWAEIEENDESELILFRLKNKLKSIRCDLAKTFIPTVGNYMAN